MPSSRTLSTRHKNFDYFRCSAGGDFGFINLKNRTPKTIGFVDM
jgi:hypothetical protein